MFNRIPVVGWFLSIAAAASMAVPFWFFWNLMDIGPFYFDFLPENWQNMSFVGTVGVFVCISILRTVAFGMLPWVIVANENHIKLPTKEE